MVDVIEQTGDLTHRSGSDHDHASVHPTVQEAQRQFNGNSAHDHGENNDTDEGQETSNQKKSVVRKVKDKVVKAKKKLKSKLKKDTDGDSSSEDDEFDDVEVQPKELLESHPNGYAADGSYVNHGKPLETFGARLAKIHAYPSKGSDDGGRGMNMTMPDSPSREPLNNLEDRMADSSNASPTLTSLDSVMPPKVIEPGSASDLGEQSSTSLGHIAEKPKEEERAVSNQAHEGSYGSSRSFGAFGEDISGRGTDQEHGQNGLESVERDTMSQELGSHAKDTKFESTPSGGVTELSAADREAKVAGKVDRELSSDGPDAPGRGERVNTDEAEKPSQAVPQKAPLTESMFSSSAANDLRHSESPNGHARDLDAGTKPSGSDGNQQVKERGAEDEKFYDPELDESSLEKTTSGISESGRGLPLTPQNSTVDGEVRADPPSESWIAKAVGLMTKRQQEEPIDKEVEPAKTALGGGPTATEATKAFL